MGQVRKDIKAVHLLMDFFARQKGNRSSLKTVLGVDKKRIQYGVKTTSGLHIPVWVQSRSSISLLAKDFEVSF